MNTKNRATIIAIAASLALQGCGSLSTSPSETQTYRKTLPPEFNVKRETDPFTKITTVSSRIYTPIVYIDSQGRITKKDEIGIRNRPKLTGVVKIHPDGQREYHISHGILMENKIMEIPRTHDFESCRIEPTISVLADGVVIGPTTGTIITDYSSYGVLNASIPKDEFYRIAFSNSVAVRSCIDFLEDDAVSQAEIDALRGVFNESIKQ